MSVGIRITTIILHYVTLRPHITLGIELLQLEYCSSTVDAVFHTSLRVHHVATGTSEHMTTNPAAANVCEHMTTNPPAVVPESPTIDYVG